MKGRQLIKQFRSKQKEAWSREKYSKEVTESIRMGNMTPWTLINSNPNNPASWSNSNPRRVKFSLHWIRNQNPRRNSRLPTAAFLRRQISSCTNLRPKVKHRWLISSQEVHLDQAWSSILKNKAWARLLAESRVLTLWTHIAVIVRTTKNSSRGDVCSSSTAWRKRCKTKEASNQFPLRKGLASAQPNWVLVARTNRAMEDTPGLFNRMASPCTSDPIATPVALGQGAMSEWPTPPIDRTKQGYTEDSALPMVLRLVPLQRWALLLVEMAPVTNTAETPKTRAANPEMKQRRHRKSTRKLSRMIIINFSRSLTVWSILILTNWTLETKNSSASFQSNINSICSSSKRWKWQRIL